MAPTRISSKVPEPAANATGVVVAPPEKGRSVVMAPMSKFSLSTYGVRALSSATLEGST